MTSQPPDRDPYDAHMKEQPSMKGRALGKHARIEETLSESPEDSAGKDTFPAHGTPAVEQGSALSGSPETVVRKRKKKKRKKHRKALVVIGTIAALLALIAIVVAVTIEMGRSNLHIDNEAPIDVPDTATAYSEGKTVVYDGHTYELNENIVSLLFIGFDRETIATEGEASGQADAIMMLALDTQTGEATAISIPRDTMVDVDVYSSEGLFSRTDTMQLCLAYNYGDGATTSCENVVTSVSRILYSIPVKYYYALDENGVGALNDAIGGVSLTPLASIPGTNIVEGEATTLFGDNAFRYVQYRDIEILNSPLDRQERQIQYIKAFASQAISSAQGNIPALVDLYNTAGDYSVTNLSVSEFSYLISNIILNGISGLETTALTGEMVQGDVYAEYYLDSDATYQTVLDVYYSQID